MTGFASSTALVWVNVMTEIHKPDALLTKLLPPVQPRPGVRYVPSVFTLSFEHGGKKYAYNTLTRQCLETELPLSCAAGEGYDSLIEGLFLVPEGKDESAYYTSVNAIMRVYNRRKGVRGFTILPTLGCNARCIYCYEEGMRQVTMTPEIVEQSIRYILENRIGNKVHIGWFGGEPLLFPAILDRITEGVEAGGVEVRGSMISNGTRITPEIIQKMKEKWHVSRIQISMDGAEEDYIKRKNFPKYDGEYSKVIEGINLLAAAGIRVTIRCNVDEGNWGNIPRYVEDIGARIPDKKLVGLYFGPLNAVRMGEHDFEMWKTIAEARPLITKAGFRPSPFLGLGHAFRVNHCMADGGSVVITPDGSLFPCEHCPEEGRFGDIFHGVTDQAALDAFCKLEVREKCRECPFLPECTSFTHCPVHDTHCREVRELMAYAGLRVMVDEAIAKAAAKKDEQPDGKKEDGEGGTDPIC